MVYKALEPKWGFPKIRGTLLGGPYNQDYSILGSILGSPYFGNLPNHACSRLPCLNVAGRSPGDGRLGLSFTSPCLDGGFPKFAGTLLGVPILRIRVYWGLYWGPLI